MQLTPLQDQVLALISAGSTITEAARNTGVHRNTVHNWIRSVPKFRLGHSRAQEAKAIFWRERATELAAEAIETIRAIMADPKAPASVRLKAAQSILNLVTTPPVQEPVSTGEMVSSVFEPHYMLRDDPEYQADAAAEPPLNVHNSAQSEPSGAATGHRLEAVV